MGVTLPGLSSTAMAGRCLSFSEIRDRQKCCLAGIHGIVGWENMYGEILIYLIGSDFEHNQCPVFSKTKCVQGCWEGCKPTGAGGHRGHRNPTSYGELSVWPCSSGVPQRTARRGQDHGLSNTNYFCAEGKQG